MTRRSDLVRRAPGDLVLPRVSARHGESTSRVISAQRDAPVEQTGQKRFPWIEFEDGSVYREESKEMTQRIRDGKLQEAPRAQ